MLHYLVPTGVNRYKIIVAFDETVSSGVYNIIDTPFENVNLIASGIIHYNDNIQYEFIINKWYISILLYVTTPTTLTETFEWEFTV